jgi:type IV secretion system protein TrbL
MADVVGITSALGFFADALDKGRSTLFGDARSLFSLLVTIEVIFAGIYMAIGGSGDLRAAARKILIIGFFSWIINSYDSILRVVLDGFIYAGQKASGVGSANVDVLRNPGLIFVEGCRIISPAFEKILQNHWWDFLTADGLLTLFCGVVGCLSFGLIAIQVFVTYLEYLIIASLGFILIPLGVFKPTAYLSEKVFGAIVGFGVKFMVLSLVVALSHQFMTRLHMPVEVSWQNALDYMVISLALAFLSFHAPSVALSIFSGSPHMSAGTIAATAAGAMMATREMAKGQLAGVGISKGVGTSAVSAIGAIQAGAAMSMAAPGANQSAMQMARSAAGGAVRGAISGLGSTISEYASHGSAGAPEGNLATRKLAGLNPNEGGIVGAFHRGQFSVPVYRNKIRQDSVSSQKGEQSQSRANSQAKSGEERKESTEGKNKA